MSNALVTGGAGFIGRWLVSKLLERGDTVSVIDDLSNGREANIEEFLDNPKFRRFVHGDIKDVAALRDIFADGKLDICYHLGASIIVQDSIDDPATTFNNDVVGTFNVLELCREYNTKLVFMSTCMVYDTALSNGGISEEHLVKPASPYAGSKLAGENMVLSYWYTYRLPVVIIRPFNTFGPFQKTNGEGGVVAIFIKNALSGQPINIYGDGLQTRDLLYVEDCARFIIAAGDSDEANGQIINAGLGRDVSINELAELITADTVSDSKIVHITHHHPQSEIMKLLCNNAKAEHILGWRPEYSLEQGIARTKDWIIYETNVL